MSNQRTAQKLVQKLLSEEKDILYIGLSSKLSGTFHMMERVLGYEAKKYPERKWYAVDSFAIGLGEGSLDTETWGRYRRSICLVLSAEMASAYTFYRRRSRLFTAERTR